MRVSDNEAADPGADIFIYDGESVGMIGLP
jgi:hypothetical protein